MELRKCVNCGYGPYPSKGETNRCPKCKHDYRTKGPGHDWARGKTWEEMGRK